LSSVHTYTLCLHGALPVLRERWLARLHLPSGEMLLPFPGVRLRFAPSNGFRIIDPTTVWALMDKALRWNPPIPHDVAVTSEVWREALFQDEVPLWITQEATARISDKESCPHGQIGRAHV